MPGRATYAGDHNQTLWPSPDAIRGEFDGEEDDPTET
jgi:hypothetical protein